MPNKPEDDFQDQLNELRGQVAALQGLVVSLYLASPNKSEVRAIFERQSERNADLDLYEPLPEAFLSGYRRRAEILRVSFAVGDKSNSD